MGFSKRDFQNKLLHSLELDILMEMFMKERCFSLRNKVKESIIIRMEISMKGNGWEIKEKVEEVYI